MVTRETRYIGQLYFGLSSDDPAEIPEWHNGDRILLMDEDKMYVYDETAVTFHEIPMGGGGGGGGVTYEDVTIRSENLSGTGQINAFYWTETGGIVEAKTVVLTLNTNITLHIQVVNGNIQLTSQTSTSGWTPYYNGQPLDMLINTNRSLGFALPLTYTPGEIITLQHT